MSVVFSVSVCPIPDPKSRMEGLGKLKIGRKEVHDTGDLVTPPRGQKIKGQGNKVTIHNIENNIFEARPTAGVAI